MKQRTVFFVSDQTGITAETLGRSLLTQFDGLKFRYVTLPFIDTPDKARDAVRRINLMAEVEGVRPLVFSTFVQNEIREIVRGCNSLLLDFFDAFIGPLERELERASSHTSGRAHGLADDAHYARRIEAVNFTLANDDGVGVQNYARADLILVGVSRSGKTPTCLYLALQYGVFAANFPLTEEHFDSERGELPSPLQGHAKKLVGLTIDAKRLEHIRANRRPDTRYASPPQISFELREAEALFKRHAIPFLDTTHASIEEIAIRILDSTGLRDRVRAAE
jgi:[pyruvate, water dikinase]-phosphate phosphotransferase / [pyruvate, water dikinase] kinase